MGTGGLLKTQMASNLSSVGLSSPAGGLQRDTGKCGRNWRAGLPRECWATEPVSQQPPLPSLLEPLVLSVVEKIPERGAYLIDVS